MDMRLPPIAPQNTLDKLISYVAPAYAVRRMEARSMLALSGGYTGARIDRAALAAWRTRAGGPVSDVIRDLDMLRQRSRDLERNAPVAAAAVNVTATHVVGTGLACLPQVDSDFLGLTEEEAEAWHADTRRRFYTWCESQDCDLARHLNFYGLQDLALRGTLVSGDVFATTPRVRRDNSDAVRLAIQLIEADRCCNPKTGGGTRGKLIEGIEHSEETGEAVLYHFCDQHPGDTPSPQDRTWQAVEARGPRTGRRNVLHLYKQLRPGLKRGVPILAPVIEPLKQLARYTDAELQAAVTAGLFSVFLKMDPTAFGDLFGPEDQKLFLENTSKWSGEMQAGQAVNLLPGEEVQVANPGRPNSEFDPFVQSCIRQIGMAIGIPYEVLVMHYQSSYSAARGALLMAWRFFGGWRDWMATYFCQPVYELWLADEVAEGRIAAPGFFADPVTKAAWCGAQWVGDGPGSIDPEKEVRAASDRVGLGISTLEAESLLHDGRPWSSKHRQTVKEAAARQEAGLAMPGAMPPAPEPPPPAPPPEPPSEQEQQRQQASDKFTRALTALALREPAAPSVNVAPPAITVEAPNVTVNVPERAITVEGSTVTVETPPPRLRERIPVRDADGNILKTVEQEIG